MIRTFAHLRKSKSPLSIQQQLRRQCYSVRSSSSCHVRSMHLVTRHYPTHQYSVMAALRFSSTTSPHGGAETTTKTVVVDPQQAGEDYYQQYVLVWNEWEKFKEEQERTKSEKMFEAWKRAQPPPPDESTVMNDDDNCSNHNHNNNNRNKNAGGVSVVRTLAREVSKNRALDPLQKLEQRATNLLQIAGVKYKHPKALIELANIELERLGQTASLNQQNDVSLNHAWVRDNVQPCLRYYEIAGDAGLSEGYYNLAHIYWDGVHALIEPDRDIAMNYMLKAIHLGDIDAMYFVGLHRLGHRNEYRLDQLQKALQWVEHAAERQHGGALQCLAVLYQRGCKELSIPPCSDDEFQRRLSLAIEHDDNGNAYWLRALSYSEGSHGYPKDIALWFNDIVQAAELGHGNACLNAGVALFHGFRGQVEQDQARAFQYYQRAGELGIIEGWRNVVDCYATGQGVKQNIEMAKYIGETMIRPYDEATQNHNHRPEEDDEEAFDENKETAVENNTVTIPEEGDTRVDKT